MRINISIDESLLQKLDARCKVEDYDRSEYIRKLIRDNLFETVEPISQNVEPIVSGAGKAVEQFASHQFDAVEVDRPPSCERCRTEAVGKFHIVKHDWEQGEVELDEHLCGFHLAQWKKDGVVNAI